MESENPGVPTPTPEPAPASAPTEPPAPTVTPLITIDDFAKVELRVARVLEAGPHPNAERLLRLKIDVGGEERQLIAGIAAHYKPEDLVGRAIVVVANLKPAKLRGELSQGMLLAASDGERVSLLMPDQDLPAGSTIR